MINNTRTKLLMCGLAVLSCCLVTSVLGDEPAPTREIVKVVDGVRQILNPATPTGPERSVRLQQSWSYSVSGEDGALPLIGLVSRVVQSGDDTIYMLDPQIGQLLEFSISDGYVRILASPGEGPGEISQAIDIAPMPGGKVAVARQMPGEIVLLDGRGSHKKKTVRLNSGGIMGFATLERIHRLPSGYALKGSALQVENGKQNVCAFLSIMNEEGVEGASIMQRCTALTNLMTGDGMKEIGDVSRSLLACGESVYLVENPDDYVITVYGLDGEIQQVVRREFERRRYTEKERDEIRSVNEAMAKKLPHVSSLFSDDPPEYAPSILSLMVRENGQLWVRPDRNIEPDSDTNPYVFDVFDDQGFYVEQVRLENEEIGNEDITYILDDCVVTLRGLVNQLPGEDVSESEDDGVIRIACYRFK